MKVLNKKQAEDFFRDVVENEFGSADLWLSGSREYLINGHMIKDWRGHSSHAVLWYIPETDSWIVVNLQPVCYWAIMKDGLLQKYVDSFDYAMHKCGYDS